MRIQWLASFTALVGSCTSGWAEPIMLVPGFRITNEAAALDHPTQVAFGPDGRLFVALQPGTILAFDYTSDGISGTPQEVAQVGSLLLGIGFDEEGSLYASSNNGVDDSGFLVRLLDEDNDGVYEVQQVFVANLPNDGHHNDQIAIDGSILYVGMGSRTDDGERDDVEPVPAATLLRVDLAQVDFTSQGNVPEVYAYGLRNAFGIAIDEQHRVWVGDNGRDSPLLQDELHIIIPGAHHGFPDEPPDFVRPVLTMGLGTSADGLDFYPAGGPWGTQYADNIFITRFDYELNDPSGVGMDLVQIVLDRSDPDRPTGVPTVFAEGFLHPLDAEVDPYGNLLVMEYGDLESAIDGRILRISPIAVPGDSDGDGDVDLNDYQAFQACFTGPNNGPYPSDCDIFDSDTGDDVDMIDFSAFQLAFTGAR